MAQALRGDRGKTKLLWVKLGQRLKPCSLELLLISCALSLGSSSFKMLLLLLSNFSHVRLCATPSAHQAPPSLGFSRQEHWSRLPFPSPMHESEKVSEVAQSCPTLSDPMDYSPPDFSIHGIFQARVLQWGAIAFSSFKMREVITDCYLIIQPN